MADFSFYSGDAGLYLIVGVTDLGHLGGDFLGLGLVGRLELLNSLNLFGQFCLNTLDVLASLIEHTVKSLLEMTAVVSVKPLHERLKRIHSQVLSALFVPYEFLVPQLLNLPFELGVHLLKGLNLSDCLGINLLESLLEILEFMVFGCELESYLVCCVKSDQEVLRLTSGLVVRNLYRGESFEVCKISSDTILKI